MRIINLVTIEKHPQIVTDDRKKADEGKEKAHEEKTEGNVRRGERIQPEENQKPADEAHNTGHEYG